MIVLRVPNVHVALPVALSLLRRVGVRRESRNGPVIVSPEPVCTVYERPRQRVMFHPWRDANPFFHLYESLWMLAGRRDVLPLVRYVKRMADYAESDGNQNAAYGYRWRRAGAQPHQRDQLDLIIRTLRHDRTSRQAVLQIWDHRLDINYPTKDRACNVAATFQIADDKLDMTVFCRSNDVIWGCYGANAVHFSMLMEYVARHVGVHVGVYRQISVNWHAYLNTYEPIAEFHSDAADVYDPYEFGHFREYPLCSSSQQEWDMCVSRFVTDDGRLPTKIEREEFYDPFFRDVAWSMVAAHDAYKSDDFVGARRWMSEVVADDWRIAGLEWIDRREARRK